MLSCVRGVGASRRLRGCLYRVFNPSVTAALGVAAARSHVQQVDILS